MFNNKKKTLKRQKIERKCRKRTFKKMGEKCNLYFKNLHARGWKVVFRITNGSAFFVLETFNTNVKKNKNKNKDLYRKRDATGRDDDRRRLAFTSPASSFRT